MYDLLVVTFDLLFFYRVFLVLAAVIMITTLTFAIVENRKINELNKDLKSRKERIDAIIYATKSGLWEWNQSSGLLQFDDSFKSLFKHTKFDFINPSLDSFRNLTFEKDLDYFNKEVNKLMYGAVDFVDFEYRILDLDGKVLWIRNYAKTLSKNKDGSPSIISGIINNITYEKELSNDKNYLTYLLEYFIENNHGGVAIFDNHMNYIYVSDHYKKQFSLTVDPIGQNHYELFPDLPEKFKKAHQRSLKGEVLGENRDVFFRADGEKLYTTWQTRPWYQKDGTIGGIISYVEVITEQVLKEISLDYEIKHDKLTGVYNRIHFIEQLSKLDEKKNYPIGIIMMDLNGLKLINDAYGYQDGDSILKIVASKLHDCREFCGNVYRVGGDEFAFISTKTDDEQIKSCIKRVQEEIEKLEFGYIHLSLSAGYAIKTNESQKIEDILKESETDMFRKKVLDSTSIRNNAIKGILQTLNDKFEVERTHSNRVQKLCVAMGEVLNLDKDDLNELSYAAILHDIGKIAIPDAILMKPAKLTDEEYEIMKTHTEKGYAILKAADEYSDLAKYALTHHEKYDGTGYPRRLKEREIPFFSRIIAVCDSFEAMTGERPYRIARTNEDAINELIRCKGKQFDPELVDIFINSVLPLEL